MLLATANQSLRIVTTDAVATDVVAWYADHTSTTFAPNTQATKITTATTTTVVSAPSASTQRQVKNLSIRNVAASGSQTVTVQLLDGATTYEIIKAPLAAGETLRFVEGAGWQAFAASGRQQVSGGTEHQSVLMPAHFSTANLTSTKAITSTNTFGVLVGRPGRPLTSAQVRFRVTTAAATITWAEVALATTPSINVGASQTLTVVGFTNVAGVVNGTGLKTVTVNVDPGQAILADDDIFVLFGNQATTAMVLRAQSIADDIQVGQQTVRVARPSLEVGSAQTHDIESATTLAPWCALVI